MIPCVETRGQPPLPPDKPNNKNTMNKETPFHTAAQIILGAIERLDKANNPHMKKLQADLVHDLNHLKGQQLGVEEYDAFLEFLPRCKSELEGEAIFEAASKREMVELLNSCVHPRFRE